MTAVRKSHCWSNAVEGREVKGQWASSVGKSGQRGEIYRFSRLYEGREQRESQRESEEASVTCSSSAGREGAGM